MALREWEKHVVKTSDGGSKIAWCGATIVGLAWAFLDAEHAIEARKRGSRLETCPDCQRALDRRFERPGPTGDAGA